MTYTTDDLKRRAPLHALPESQRRHLTWRKREVTLLLGNDREIGRHMKSQERRVGITPPHVAALRQQFSELGIRLAVRVVENAGARAGWADADFVHAGAEIVTYEELPHDAAPDVVHALKEPSRYESTISGPFVRIGALHSGDFDADAGFARLLMERPAGVFDGSNIGSNADFRKPIRGSMSVFAGRIAAEWVLEHLAQNPDLAGHGVVVGGGKVGIAAAKKLLTDPRIEAVTLFDRAEDEQRLQVIRQQVADGRVQVLGLRGCDDPRLLREIEGAAGFVLGPAMAGGRAPKIVTSAALEAHGKRNAMVVDVSIDERGAIHDDRVDPDWPSEKIIDFFAHHLGQVRYQAVTNMPRAYPREASAEHGDAIVPYLATLLFLAAREGGPEASVQHVLRLPFAAAAADPQEAEGGVAFARLCQDLRNGLAVHTDASGAVLHAIIPPGDRDLIAAHLRQHGCAVAVPPGA